MAEHFRDSDFRSFENFESFPNGDREDFVAETELVRGANRLPTLSRRLRARVLNAATSTFRQARRWTQARQAASFLSLCLLASFVLSPLANSSFPGLAWERLTRSSVSPIDLSSHEGLASPQQPGSVWSLRHDRDFLELPREAVLASPTSKTQISTKKTPIVAVVAEPAQPPDKLLATLQTSDGWATVQAFDAIRTRSRSTLLRAFAAN